MTRAQATPEAQAAAIVLMQRLGYAVEDLAAGPWSRLVSSVDVEPAVAGELLAAFREGHAAGGFEAGVAGFHFCVVQRNTLRVAFGKPVPDWPAESSELALRIAADVLEDGRVRVSATLAWPVQEEIHAV